ncbi:hypothetical protein [Sulfurimonas sp. HSL3-2]|uniref:hypothetical protein n=1 Tax=Hydrocurvibacter mobilis TaxID=3131936 RepID=UPI0031F94585
MKIMKKSMLTLSIILLTGCASMQTKAVIPEGINESSYQGYRTIDPLPVSKVKKYDSSTNTEKEVYWASISDKKEKRSLLPIQSSQVSVKKLDRSGNVSYLTASISGETGEYSVVMDYMKYRVEEVLDSTGKFLGNGRIGVGLRIKAEVKTNKANLNLGSILSLGIEANQGNLSGGISVDIIGIDSEGVTNLIPMTSEIDQTAIQSALQALASVKAKLWEKDVTITPHLVAITDATPSNEEEIRKLAK